MEVSRPQRRPHKRQAGVKRMGNCGNDGGQEPVASGNWFVISAGLREVSSKDSLHRLVPCRD